MGRIGDKFGRKRVFLFGLVTFTMFSFLCGIAPDIRWLVAFRAGQGVGGAALLTVSLAIVLGAFPRRQQGTAVGLWAALGTAAAAVGPVLGGVLLNYGHWSWIFFVNIPVGVFALVVCGMVIPRDVKSVGPGGRPGHPGHAHLGRRPLHAHARPGAGRRMGLDLAGHPRAVRRRHHHVPAVHLA